MKKLMTILPMRTIMKNTLMAIFAILLAVGFVSNIAKATETETIITFEDPSGNSGDPLFTVDFRTGAMKFTGGWSDAKSGLTLEIPYSSSAFENAWFDMTDVTITSKITIPGFGTYGTTGGGIINFYEDNSLVPLATVSFSSGSISQFGFGADNEFVLNNATITGLGIVVPFSEEQFAFSFANKKKLSGSATMNDGFTTTASFTSSARIPEPATICILSLGALSLIRRKKIINK
ncbi:MAG: hypothetical protein ACYC3B_04190 [Sedimentisphaerales bacterium]